jgi:hypothetical protein
MIVKENSNVVSYIKKRGLTSQYLKAKKNLVNGDYRAVDLKKRVPRKNNIWYFRITKKYRALAEKVGNTLYVFNISDHQ